MGLSLSRKLESYGQFTRCDRVATVATAAAAASRYAVL